MVIIVILATLLTVGAVVVVYETGYKHGKKEKERKVDSSSL